MNIRRMLALKNNTNTKKSNKTIFITFIAVFFALYVAGYFGGRMAARMEGVDELL